MLGLAHEEAHVAAHLDRPAERRCDWVLQTRCDLVDVVAGPRNR